MREDKKLFFIKNEKKKNWEQLIDDNWSYI